MPCFTVFVAFLGLALVGRQSYLMALVYICCACCLCACSLQLRLIDRIFVELSSNRVTDETCPVSTEVSENLHFQPKMGFSRMHLDVTILDIMVNRNATLFLHPGEGHIESGIFRIWTLLSNSRAGRVSYTLTNSV